MPRHRLTWQNAKGDNNMLVAKGSPSSHGMISIGYEIIIYPTVTLSNTLVARRAKRNYLTA